MIEYTIFTYGACGHQLLEGGQLNTCFVYGWCKAPSAEAARIYATNIFHKANPKADLASVEVKASPELALINKKLN